MSYSAQKWGDELEVQEYETANVSVKNIKKLLRNI